MVPPETEKSATCFNTADEAMGINIHNARFAKSAVKPADFIRTPSRNRVRR